MASAPFASQSQSEPPKITLLPSAMRNKSCEECIMPTRATSSYPKPHTARLQGFDGFEGWGLEFPMAKESYCSKATSSSDVQLLSHDTASGEKFPETEPYTRNLASTMALQLLRVPFCF